MVNALTDQFHPCQTLADLLTIREHKGRTAGLTMTFLGDAACNMGHSYLLSGATAGMHVRVGAPSGFQPDRRSWRGRRSSPPAPADRSLVIDDPKRRRRRRRADHRHLDLDGQGGRVGGPRGALRPSRSRPSPLALAAPDAIVLHCLPAYRGKEITAGVLDGPQSVVWDEAENRLHAQKAIIDWLLRRRALTRSR